MQVIEQIVNASEGDLRKAITYLQSAARLKDSDEITEQDICEIAGVIPTATVDALIKACYSDSYERLQSCVKVSARHTMCPALHDGTSGGVECLSLQELISEGYSAAQTLNQVQYSQMHCST